jgi:hypothetical protein
MVLTVSFVLSPVIGLCCHRRLADIGVSGPLGLTSPSARLDASVEASGPHDFAVRCQRPRQKHRPRPPHPVPNVRDDRETPLMWDGMAGIMEVIWARREIFFRIGLDRWNRIDPVQQISVWRKWSLARREPRGAWGTSQNFCTAASWPRPAHPWSGPRR